MLTFQIGLHIDDLFILEYIKNYLNCGHISISGKFCNFFINDCCPIVMICTVPLLLISLGSSVASLATLLLLTYLTYSSNYFIWGPAESIARPEAIV